MRPSSTRNGLLICREAKIVRLHQLFLASDRGVLYPRAKQSGASEFLIAEGLALIKGGRLYITAAGRTLHAMGPRSSTQATGAKAA